MATIKLPAIPNRWSQIPSWLIRKPVSESDIFPDLRQEMHTWLYGNDFDLPRGIWVVHREMLLDQVSPKWDDENKEAYSGYRWIYKDHLIRARRPTYPAGVPNEASDALGVIQVPSGIMFVEWNTNIKKEDYILMLTKADFLTQPPPNLVTIEMEYSILRVDRVEGDLGRTEYLRLFLTKSNPNPELSIMRW